MGVRLRAPQLLADRRAGRGRQLVVAVPAARRVPPFPLPGLPRESQARAAWRSLWRSPVSAAIDINADGPLLRRWLNALDDIARFRNQVAHEGSIVAGSQGQPVEHPLLRAIARLNRECARCEEHLALSPLSRFRLQLVYAEAQAAGHRLDRVRSHERPGRREGVDGFHDAQGDWHEYGTER